MRNQNFFLIIKSACQWKKYGKLEDEKKITWDATKDMTQYFGVFY